MHHVATILRDASETVRSEPIADLLWTRVTVTQPGFLCNHQAYETLINAATAPAFRPMDSRGRDRRAASEAPSGQPGPRWHFVLGATGPWASSSAPISPSDSKPVSVLL